MFRIIGFKRTNLKKLNSALQNLTQKRYIKNTETVGETSVSSGCWGEDSNYELADAAHFHVASSAL